MAAKRTSRPRKSADSTLPTRPPSGVSPKGPGALVPGGPKKLFEKDIHAAAKHMNDALDRYLKLPIGRQVRDSREGTGTVLEWQPLGHGMTDAFIAFDNGKRIMCGLAGMKPADGKGPLPSRRAAMKLAEVSRDVSMHAIAKTWGGKEAPATSKIVRGKTETPTFSLRSPFSR